jgi:plastocyanin
MNLRLSSLLAVLVIACAGWLTACGSDDESSGDSGSDSTAATGDLTVTAAESGDLSWDPTELTAKAGKVTVTLDNPSPVDHNIEIEGQGVEEQSDTITDGTTSVSANLKPGEYEFYCDVPGHKEAGMEGTLTVE